MTYFFLVPPDDDFLALKELLKRTNEYLSRAVAFLVPLSRACNIAAPF